MFSVSETKKLGFLRAPLAKNTLWEIIGCPLPSLLSYVSWGFSAYFLGFPIAYEVLPGNTADKTTLRQFLQKIALSQTNAMVDTSITVDRLPGIWIDVSLTGSTSS